jgi:hypothetical protein
LASRYCEPTANEQSVDLPRTRRCQPTLGTAENQVKTLTELCVRTLFWHSVQKTGSAPAGYTVPNTAGQNAFQLAQDRALSSRRLLCTWQYRLELLGGCAAEGAQIGRNLKHKPRLRALHESTGLRSCTTCNVAAHSSTHHGGQSGNGGVSGVFALSQIVSEPFSAAPVVMVRL